VTDTTPDEQRERRLKALELENKDLREEGAFDKRIIAELHAKVARLEAHKLPDPHLLARRIHEVLYDMGSAPGGETWLLAPIDWRRRLLQLIENYYSL